MCLERFSVTGFEAIKIEPWLSPQIGMGLKVVAELPQKGMHPDYLAATIRERHVLSFSGRQRNGFLRS
jgi:hypothetical protein